MDDEYKRTIVNVADEKAYEIANRKFYNIICVGTAKELLDKLDKMNDIGRLQIERLDDMSIVEFRNMNDEVLYVLLKI